MKLIPGTDDFSATEDGRIFGSDGVEQSYYRNGDGYVTAAVRKNGKWETMGVHRLVALTYLADNRSPERDFVNHIDGDVSNNHRDNLEWVTSYENNIHSTLMRTDLVRTILILTSPSGEMIQAKSSRYAEELIGCNFKELWSAVKHGILIDGWKVEYRNGIIPMNARKKNHQAGKPVSVKIMDVETREVREFPTIRSAADFIGGSETLIQLTACSVDKIRLCLNRYLVIKGDGEFPPFDAELIEKLRNRLKRPVLSKDLKTGKIVIHPTATDFYTKHGLSKKAVTSALRIDRLREIEGKIFLYMTNENLARINSYSASSGETK